MNVQKYVTQHFKFLFTNSSSSTIYTDSRTSLDSFNQVPFDNENILEEENNNEIDEEERKSLQIRFISVSSVSSSAFTTNHTTDDTNSDSINAKESLFSRKRRERSNTLERLEEEKRVRWLDEHSGALVSSFDTTLSLPSETLTYIHFHHLPDALFTSSSLKLSPSFELLAISSPTRHQGLFILYLSVIRVL